MIQIDLLKNHSQTIPVIAKIWYEVLGKIWMPEISIKEIQDGYYKELNENIPLAYVAMHNDMPVGSCSLKLNDGIRPELSPWLADLIVEQKYQSRGIGKMLINTAVEKARESGFEKLYLFAFDPKLSDYYANLGWKKISMDEFEFHPVIVMELEL